MVVGSPSWKGNLMSYTRTLADYAARLEYEDLPREVIEQAKLLTLHTLGVALAACDPQNSKFIARR